MGRPISRAPQACSNPTSNEHEIGESYISPEACGNASRTRGLVIGSARLTDWFFVVLAALRFVFFFGFLLGFWVFGGFLVWNFLFRFEFYSNSKFWKFEICSNLKNSI
jgi:hypothetical protein